MEDELHRAELCEAWERVIWWEGNGSDKRNEQTATSVYGRGNETTDWDWQERTSLATQIYTVKGQWEEEEGNKSFQKSKNINGLIALNSGTSRS